MDRSIEPDEREPDPTAGLVPDPRRDRTKEQREKPSLERERPPVDRTRRDLDLTESQRETLGEIGRFRTVSMKDLAQFRYNDDQAKMRQDILRLSSQKLVQTRSFWLGKDKGRLQVITLTRHGKRVLEQSGERGTFYTGFVKPAEMAHDAAIYRMYQAEATRIAKQGGQIRGITLDYELKRSIYSPLAKERPGTAQYKKRQAEIAAEHGLKVVRGHIQLPDLRIEYQTRAGEIERRDLELATNQYRGGQLASKAEAGFTFYSSSQDVSHLSSIFDDHSITAEILCL
jgi:hypothetical protein